MAHKPIDVSSLGRMHVPTVPLSGGDHSGPSPSTFSPEAGDVYQGPPHEAATGLIAPTSQLTHPVFRHIVTTRASIEERENRDLAPYAAKSLASRGQLDGNEPLDPHRTIFMRDRDRILYSRHFRRLGGVRQVPYPRDNTYKRTRITHTMEVAQIARSIARALRLNEDLAEAIALGHDLGHPPFGHDGEEALNAMMQRFGMRFEHNVHSYRIIRRLACYSPRHRGLNPSIELLYGIALHRSPYDDPPSDAVDIALPRQPPLEGQVVNIADVIAYVAHDTDDALQAHLPGIGIERLKELRLIGTIMDDLTQKHGAMPDTYARPRLTRELIDRMISQAIAASALTIAQRHPTSIDDVYQAADPFIVFSDAMQRDTDELRNFLYHMVYKQGEALARAQSGRQMVENLFARLFDNPALLPHEVRITETMTDRERAIAICDIIASLTDGEAESWHEHGPPTGHAA